MVLQEWTQFLTYRKKEVRNHKHVKREAQEFGSLFAPVWKNFNNFMRCDANKTELFTMISQKASSLSTPIVVATVSEGIVTSEPSLNSLHNQLSPCNHEEAHTCLILHILKGSSKNSIVSVDTDVVVISFYHFFLLDLDELWIEFGVGKNKRYLPIHDYAKVLSEEICRVLSFWFAMTECDTVSMFAGRGKKSAWNAWDSFKEVAPTFVRFV